MIASSVFISQEELDGLGEYKYSGTDHSILSRHVLRHYWDASLNLFPIWMAPNLITLIGFLFIIFNYALMCIMIPDLVGPAPSWVYLTFATLTWLYSTFDNVDGKQARRTKSSSPLGEMFDHGCDALSASLMTLIQIATFGVGTHSHIHLLFPVCYLGGFYLCTWETYHTGSLTLGYLNGPTEGIVLICATKLLSAIYGPSIWHAPVEGFSLWLGREWLWYEALYLLMVLAFVLYQVPSCLISVYRHGRRHHRSFLSYLAAITRLFPIVLYLSAYTLWATGPFSSLWSDHPILFVSTLCIVFGRIATKIIMAHVTRTRFPQPTVLLLPLVIGAYAANFLPQFAFYELYFMYCYFLFAFINYMLWARVVIHGFCTYLKISCFSLSSLRRADD